jgi:hypothetical protein
MRFNTHERGLQMRRTILLAIAALALAVTGSALAHGGGGGGDKGKRGDKNGKVTGFGGAMVSKRGAVLTANTGNTSTVDDFSGITIPVKSGMTFGEISHLSTKFNVTDDDCGAGSPRFQIRVGGKNVFVALGPAGTLTGCEKNTWIRSGDLTEATAAECRVDTSQFAPGTQCNSWAGAAALLGSQTVEGITLVVDASWAGSTNPAFADKEQTVLVKKVSLNGRTYLGKKHRGHKHRHHKHHWKSSMHRFCD